MLAFALRHQPHQFGVALNDEGFTNLNDLVVGIRFSHYDWATIDREQVEEAIRSTEPGRFEIQDEQVRARYGHSVQLGAPGERRTPPDLLLHGTSADSIAILLAHRLRPMNRAFVHLTTNQNYAVQVAAAKGGGEVLRVRAKDASDSGIEFFQANSHVWLARAIAADYLKPFTSSERYLSDEVARTH